MDDTQKKLAEELLFAEEKKAGFAKRLYFGAFEGGLVFPYPEAEAEEERRLAELMERFEAFADKEIDPVKIDRESAIPDRVIEGLGQLGILGMSVPKEHGGLGMTQRSYCKVAEALASRCAATALFLNAHQSIGLKALLLFGTDAQRERWLPLLAKGEILAAFSLTEPNAGSDASGVETEAVWVPEKGVYRINGRKQWTTNGSIAGVLTVMAQTEVDTPKGKQKKVTAFLVTPDMAGFTVVARALDKVGMRGSKTANLHFSDMEVPKENILGPVGGGLKVCLSVLDYGRTTFGATCTGAAKMAMERAVKHAKERYQFKRPLASFELVKKKIAMMSALVYAMDAATYMTAGFIDAGVEDIMLESAILKVFCSESLWTVLYDTMQIFGGRSFFTDEPFERMMRDARLNMIGEGSNEVMRAFIGVVGMRDVGMQMKGAVDALKSPLGSWGALKKALGGWAVHLKVPEVAVRSEHLKDIAKELGGAVRRFGLAVVRLLAKHREDVLERQLLLDRVANCAIALYTATAVIGKLDTTLAKGEEIADELTVGKLYCRMAFDTIQNNLDGLWSNFDEEIVTVADRITGVEKR